MNRLSATCPRAALTKGFSLSTWQSDRWRRLQGCCSPVHPFSPIWFLKVTRRKEWNSVELCCEKTEAAEAAEALAAQQLGTVWQQLSVRTKPSRISVPILPQVPWFPVSERIPFQRWGLDWFYIFMIYMALFFFKKNGLYFGLVSLVF